MLALASKSFIIVDTIRSEDDFTDSIPPVMVYVVKKLLVFVNPDDIVYVFLFSLVTLIVDGLLEGGVGNCGRYKKIPIHPKQAYALSYILI